MAGAYDPGKNAALQDHNDWLARGGFGEGIEMVSDLMGEYLQSPISSYDEKQLREFLESGPPEGPDLDFARVRALELGINKTLRAQRAENGS